jgi:hypothetical protein
MPDADNADNDPYVCLSVQGCFYLPEVQAVISIRLAGSGGFDNQYYTIKLRYLQS